MDPSAIEKMGISMEGQQDDANSSHQGMVDDDDRDDASLEGEHDFLGNECKVIPSWLTDHLQQSAQ